MGASNCKFEQVISLFSRCVSIVQEEVNKGEKLQRKIQEKDQRKDEISIRVSRLALQYLMAKSSIRCSPGGSFVMFIH